MFVFRKTTYIKTKMNRFILLAAVLLAAVSCTGNSRNTAEATSVERLSDRVEIIYFHSKRRCATCKAIEGIAKEVTDSIAGIHHGNKAVLFRSVDISDSHNDDIAAEYEAAGSKLIVAGYADGRGDICDMTQYAFANARRSPESFRKALTAEIEKRL